MICIQLSSSQMNELLNEYDEAIRTKGSEIRSHEGETINRCDSALERPSGLSRIDDPSWPHFLLHSLFSIHY